MKRLSPQRASTFFLAAVAGLLLCAGNGDALGAQHDPAVYQSATVCAQCHPEIVRTWLTSQHATSFVSPSFQLPYDRIRRSSPGKTLYCEQCHNPMRFLLPPGDPRAAIFAQEGVTCDFCHSVESVDPSGPFPRYRAKPGVKFGPRGGEPKKKFHTTKFSGLHITSEFCAGCHEFATESGFKILETYSEWAASFYKGEGVHCQFCHLPQIFDARFIDPAGKKGPLDHAMVGGHSRERLAKSIPVRAALRISGNEARLTVSLKNELVGHKTPSGIPTHRLRLTSTIYNAAGTPLGRQEEVFERVVGDGTGKALEKAELIFTAAREVLKDNRIGPKETREIRHVFPLGNGKPATAEVALTYEIPTTDIAPEFRMIDILVSRTVVPVTPAIPAPYIALIALGTVVVLLAAVLYLRRRGPGTGTQAP